METPWLQGPVLSHTITLRMLVPRPPRGITILVTARSGLSLLYFGHYISNNLRLCPCMSFGWVNIVIPCFQAPRLCIPHQGHWPQHVYHLQLYHLNYVIMISISPPMQYPGDRFIFNGKSLVMMLAYINPCPI
jgi:hypothetical protein